MKAIGHLFAASVVNGGPAPCFLAPWVYEYMVNGLSCALQAKPMLNESSKLKTIFDKVFILFLKYIVFVGKRN